MLQYKNKLNTEIYFYYNTIKTNTLDYKLKTETTDTSALTGTLKVGTQLKQIHL